MRGGVWLALAAVAACAHAPFVAADGGFAIHMPAGMTHEKTRSVETPLGHLEEETFTAAHRSANYFVIRGRYPTALSAQAAPTALAEAEAAARGSDRLISDKKLEIEGRPGLELVLLSPRSVERVVRIVVAGKEVYRFGAEYPKGRPPADLDEYLTSFKLAPR